MHAVGHGSVHWTLQECGAVSSACCRVWPHAPALLLIPRGYRDEADDKECDFTSRQKC